MRLPEVRHNLRLINEACKGDLDGLAKEARALEERKKWVQQEDARLRKRVEEEAQRKYSEKAQLCCLLTPFYSDCTATASASCSRRY